MQFLTLVFLFVFPVIAVFISRRIPALNAIIICYAAGILLGNTFPGLLKNNLVHTVSEAVVILALPLMLFSADFKEWLRRPGAMLKAYGLLLVSVAASAIITFSLFQSVPSAALSAAMYSGVLSGGTPNLNAVGVALEADEALFVLLNGYDVIISGIYFFLLITVLKPALKKILPPGDEPAPQTYRGAEKFISRDPLKLKAKNAGIALLSGLLVLGVTIGASFLLFGAVHNLFVIITSSTLGIALSFSKRIRALPLTFETGDYLLLTFALGMGYLVRIEELWQSDLSGFALCAVLFIFMFVIHLGLSKLFGVDVDRFLISSTAGVFGPPFIGPVATATGTERYIAPGVAVAVIGHAGGTYMGVLLFQLFS